tara:strand:+ start:69 stop:272 length:204 start_codon:yes stop_codon:yes gene_type:complete
MIILKDLITLYPEFQEIEIELAKLKESEIAQIFDINASINNPKKSLDYFLEQKTKYKNTVLNLDLLD